MKKLVQINTVCNGSIGNIMGNIEREALRKGYYAISFYGRRKGYIDIPSEKFGSYLSFFEHILFTTLFDAQGRASRKYTKKIVERLREIEPDIIHLHNLHGYYLNLNLLFNYLTEEFQGKVVWTFHDCWPITGHCPYFILVNCNKWKNMCEYCPNKRNYPISWGLDNSRKNYAWKRSIFRGLNDLTIICPSNWMKDVVKHSFLKDRNCVVVSNGIDQSIFYPRNKFQDIQKYQIPDNKIIILGVASIWEERKGLNDFITLSDALPKEFCIVLVGLNRFQKKRCNNMVGILRTENQEELAQLYSKADIFINPSKEESFSLVTVEAMACGTPVIAMNSSATKELISSENGILLNTNTITDYMSAIQECLQKKFSSKIVCESVKDYTVENMKNKVLEIYESINDEDENE